MEITEVRVKLYGDERLKAFVNVIFDDAFIVRGVKVIDGPKGLFVSMPSRARADGTYQDICHPLNGSMRDCIEKAILRGYEKVAITVQPSQAQVANSQVGANNDSPRDAVSA
jgi:stage V sporulation protein G